MVIDDYQEYKKAHITKECAMQDEIKYFEEKILILTSENQNQNLLIKDIKQNNLNTKETLFTEKINLENELTNLNMKLTSLGSNNDQRVKELEDKVL